MVVNIMEGKVKIPGWRGFVPRKERILLAVVLILSIVLTSCSGLAGAPTLTPPPPVPTSTIPPALTPLPPTRLNIGIESSKLTGNILEFILSNQPTFGDSIVAGFTHPGLFKIDPNTGNLIKAVAASDLQEWLPNGNTWEMDVVLNPDMKWNNGTPISSEDVVFSINTIKTLTRYQTGINHTNVETLSISPSQPGSVKITLSKDPSMLIGLKSVLTFPIINREFWTGKMDDLTRSEEFRKLGSLSDQIELNQSNQLMLEHRQDILIQQISDASIVLSGTKVSLKYMQDYVDNKGYFNKNAVKDSEIASSYTMQIPGLTHLVVMINDIQIDLQSQLADIRAKLDEFRAAQTNLIQQQKDLMSGLSTSTSENDKAEPLLIPYKLDKADSSQGNRIVLRTLTHNERMPDLISFIPDQRANLLDLYSRGELDAILTHHNQAMAPGNILYTSFPTVTGMFFNPKSDQLLFPALRIAISCIYSSPEIWADEPKPGELILFTPLIPVPTEKDAIGCNGDLPTRLNSMLELLKVSGYTWQVDQTGMILPGTFTDPRGKIIPSLQINVSPSVNLPAAVQEKFKRSIINLGIEVSIQTDPDNDSELIISEATTADIIIYQWISTQQGEASLCGILPQLFNSGFPGYLINDINSKCQPDSASRDTIPVPSPTPPVMVSGKIAKSEGLAQPWLTLLYGSHPELAWVPGLETKYDISWLQTLSPVWISGWGN
jgi:hypothetical protein